MVSGSRMTSFTMLRRCSPPTNCAPWRRICIARRRPSVSWPVVEIGGSKTTNAKTGRYDHDRNSPHRTGPLRRSSSPPMSSGCTSLKLDYLYQRSDSGHDVSETADRLHNRPSRCTHSQRDRLCSNACRLYTPYDHPDNGTEEVNHGYQHQLWSGWLVSSDACGDAPPPR